MPPSENRAPFRAIVNVLAEHWLVKLILLIGGVAAAVQLSATPFATPQIHVSGSDPSSPFVFPFSLTNSSALIPLGDVDWSCTVVHMETIGHNTFDNDTVRSGGNVGSVDAGGISNHVCNVMNSGVPVSKLSMDVTVNYTMLHFWHRAPVKKRFTWVADGAHSAWVEGDID